MPTTSRSRAAEQNLSVQECPPPPPGPTSHAGRARTGAPAGRSGSLAAGRAVRGSRPDQCVDHRPCLPVFFRWLHFRQPRRQQPHVAAHSSDHRIGSGLRPRDRRPFVGARHPLRPHFARSSSAGHQWSAARDTSWLTLITSRGRHIMRRSVRQAPSAASTRPPHRTAVARACPCGGSTTFRDKLVNNRRGGRCGMRPPEGISRPRVSQADRHRQPMVSSTWHHRGSKAFFRSGCAALPGPLRAPFTPR